MMKVTSLTCSRNQKAIYLAVSEACQVTSLTCSRNQKAMYLVSSLTWSRLNTLKERFFDD